MKIKLVEYSDDTEMLKELVNRKDLRGNTPLTLTAILRDQKKHCQEYLEIFQLLFKAHADLKIRNSEKKSALDIALSARDEESVTLLFGYALQRRIHKINKNKFKAAHILSQLDNFYLEMDWEVNVPVVGFICPKDTCKIWKYGPNVKMDYTFQRFNKMSSIRSPSSFLFKSNRLTGQQNVFKVDHQKKNYFDLHEPFDEEESQLLINEVINSSRISGEFKLKNCEISQFKSFWGKKPVFETVKGLRAQKYNVKISSNFNLLTFDKFEYQNCFKENYFNPNIPLQYKRIILMDEDQMKNNLVNGLKVKDAKMKEQILKINKNKDKNLKAFVWIAENYPLQSSTLSKLFDSISDANEFTQKIKEFLNDEEVKNILGMNGFPIKIKIPVNFMVDVTMTFSNFGRLESRNEFEMLKIFEIPKDYMKISRKVAQNLASDEKKRMGYANIPL